MSSCNCGHKEYIKYKEGEKVRINSGKYMNKIGEIVQLILYIGNTGEPIYTVYINEVGQYSFNHTELNKV